MSNSSDSSRDLLFGLLALHNGLIDQGALSGAFAAWTRDKGRALADHLVDLGHLDAARRAAVEAIAAVHVKTLGDDIEKSLAALTLGRSTCETMPHIAEPDVETTLGNVGPAQPSTHADHVFMRSGTLPGPSAQTAGPRFRIIRPHARGGLGAVFVALDSELDREVALKQILDDRADDPTSRFRFLMEAHISGGLEHPGIVPVYGMGYHGDGRPYYAMRFIRGDSLKEAIDRFHHQAGTAPGSRDLALRKLLRRFMDVCNAIDYAHSRGVLHRDLKPANIVVGKHGETLVVDWGLAKPMGRALPGVESNERLLTPSTASGSSETLPGSALGTPAFMSPEQAEGHLDRLGPWSDVYSLGATLYCMVTGLPPFEGDLVEVIRAVQRGEFRSPRQLDPAIDPALESICMKAMAHRPEDRYASARALADDLDRWMADEPVSAWREPFSRRARRWARRNRTAATAAVAALVTGVVGLSGVLVVQTQAKADLAASLTRETSARLALADSNADLTRAKAAVQARYDLAVEAIKTFHTGVSQDFLLKQEQFKDVRDRLLKSASDFYGKLGALLGKESDLASRRALWQANFEVAGLTFRVGNPADALAAHRQVLAARERLAAETQAAPEIKADVGQSLTAIALLLATTGKSSAAEAQYRSALALYQQLADNNPSEDDFWIKLSDCHLNLGWLLHRMGESSAAEVEYRKALAIQQKLADDNPSLADFRDSLGLSHDNLGLLLLATGKAAEAETETRKGLALFQKLADDNPGSSQFRERLAYCHMNLGWECSQKGDSSAAEVEYRKSLAIHQQLADDNPGVIEFRSRLVQCHIYFGGLLSRIGKGRDAAAECRAGLAIQQKLADENPAIPQFQRDLGDILLETGAQLAQAGQTVEAIGYYTREEAIRQKLALASSATPDDQDSLANCLTNMADPLRSSGRLDEALAACDRAVAIRQPLVDAHPDLSRYRESLGETYLRLGQVRCASEDLAGATAAWKRACTLYGGSKSLSGEHTFVLACCHAGLAGMAGRPGSGVPAALGASQAEKAMALLRQAVTSGYRNKGAYRAESGLDPLRDRPDFRALIMDLAFPAEPIAR